ncbi:hypothetical protein VTH06DRAFT_8817 [Thermothelomyces fergusii]
MLKFSGSSYLIRGQPWGVLAFYGRNPQHALSEVSRCYYARRGLDGRNDARTGMPARENLAGAMCVQRFDDSRNSAIHITYRISLRSSSMPEPRDPLLKVLTYSVHKRLRAANGCQRVSVQPPAGARGCAGPGARGGAARRSNGLGVAFAMVWGSLATL